MPEEMISIVNEKDEVVGITSFSEAHRTGLLHREAYVYFINSNGEVLLQKRKDDGLWDHSAAGHLGHKDSYVEGAKREFEEEVGIKIEADELQEIGYERLNSSNLTKKNFRFAKIYLVRKNISLDNFKIDHFEVEDIKFFDKNELQKLVSQPHLLRKTAKLLIEKYILSRL